MTSQFMLTEIISEMKDPLELPKAYALISAPFQLVIFLVAGLGGYLFIGDKVHGMINENLPFGVCLQIAAFCLVSHMLISYLIKGVVWCTAIVGVFDPEYKTGNDKYYFHAFWTVVVVLTLMAAWVLANVVPFFEDAVDLLGASFTPLSCWVIPIALFTRWHFNADKTVSKVSRAEWTAMFFELLLACILMVLGTWSAADNIVTKWGTYGYPFQCHCEHLWNTCQCSNDHVGMQEICPVSLAR